MNDKETETMESCPFCKVAPQIDDGNYVTVHLPECFFTKHYAQEMWLVGKREKAAWNTRPATLEDRALDCIDELIQAIPSLDWNFVTSDNGETGSRIETAEKKGFALLREAGRGK